jgi:hypothetical protein
LDGPEALDGIAEPKGGGLRETVQGLVLDRLAGQALVATPES